jgi:hypothetical protein
MDFKSFRDKYTSKETDYDGKYGSQCVDLYRLYCAEVLKIPQSPGVSGAADIWTTYLTQYFQAITNTPDAIPEYGDIIIWNRRLGNGYGHVAIYIRGDANSFVSFDTNWPEGSLAHEQTHNYKSVQGWLRYKTMSDTIQVNLNDWQRARKSMDLVKGIHDYLGLEGDHIDTTVEAYTSVIGGYRSQATTLRNELATARAEVENRKEQVSRLKDDFAKKEALLFDVQTALKQSSDKLVQLTASYDSHTTDLKRSIDIIGAEKGELNIKVSKLEAENAELKKGISKPLTLLDVVKMIVPKIIEALKSIKLGGI